ncbi:hypothetical protein [Inhella gelatinilytica]|uniref:Uncharacterized protein n=1 Tax=Inhella gelatinilytica TaxID=2795030 RepID=A0A931N9T8_9BURK|nr:hypothetical protein [Inhella gelatinilytica]MBH9551718.1 hypothetical protein [Inhella gelatinilytica]
MSSLRKTALGVAVAAALISSSVSAQNTKKPAQPAPAAKPTVSAASKVMTRDELRRCIKIQDDTKALSVELERYQAEAAPEKARIAQMSEDLKAQRQALDGPGARLKDLQAAFKEQKEKADDWKRRYEELEDQKGSRTYEKRKMELAAEQKALSKRADELEAQRKELYGPYEAAAAAYNEKAAAYDAAANAWNARNDKAAQLDDKIHELKADYAAECANRKFDENDEKAIRQGK